MQEQLRYDVLKSQSTNQCWKSKHNTGSKHVRHSGIEPGLLGDESMTLKHQLRGFCFSFPSVTTGSDGERFLDQGAPEKLDLYHTLKFQTSIFTRREN